MTRNLRVLTETEFDVLVVGAGIYGATIAWEAAQRGLTVALVDRGDFGGGTSLNSLKTVHGGLRSLQRGNIADTRRFLRERRAFLRIAPHLVEPLRFAIPTYSKLIRSKQAMRIALTVNDAIGSDRNAGLDPARRLPASGVMNRDEMLRLFPGLDAARVTGGAQWYEAQMYNADRLLLAFVQSAAAAGASVANYVGATGFLRRGDRVAGISARDELSGDTLDIRARVTINAAGGWASPLTKSVFTGGSFAGLQMSKALNIVTRLRAPACALGDAADGQFLFCVPWRGIAAFGTWHAAHDGGADDLVARESDVATFLRAINRAFPAARVGFEDVTLVHRGLLPVSGVREDGQVALETVSCIRDHRADGAPGLITVIGVRFTTARMTAEQTLDQVSRVLRRSLRASQTATLPLTGGDIADITAFIETARHASVSIDAASLTRLARSYGTAYPRVVAILESEPRLRASLGATCAITGAEVQYAMREEMAVRLPDVLQRRTEAGSAAHPGDAVEACAAIMAREYRWNAARIAAEIDAVEERYRLR